MAASQGKIEGSPPHAGVAGLGWEDSPSGTFRVWLPTPPRARSEPQDVQQLDNLRIPNNGIPRQTVIGTIVQHELRPTQEVSQTARTGLSDRDLNLLDFVDEGRAQVVCVHLCSLLGTGGH